MTCLLVADDLTGACDSAVHFAAAGLRVSVPLVPDGAPAEAQVLACSTESRDILPAEAARRIRQFAARLEARAPRIVYKKIDSTLRGNTGVEIVAALAAFGCDAAVINPAFPVMGRIVRGGTLHVTCDAAFQPVELAAWLRACGGDASVHVPAGSLASAIRSGARFISLDAVCDEDLRALAAEGLATGKRILWAGSAGLAGALARHLDTGAGTHHSPSPSPGPVLFCIGSNHPVTVEQQRRLAENRANHFLISTAADLLRILSTCRPAALFVCGGDTVSRVCAALGARSIELGREFAPGIPEGILHGGLLDGIPLLTKSGGFGAPDDLIRIADHFHA